MWYAFQFKIDEYLFINVERLKCHTTKILLWKINSYKMFHCGCEIELNHHWQQQRQRHTLKGVCRTSKFVTFVNFQFNSIQFKLIPIALKKAQAIELFQSAERKFVCRTKQNRTQREIISIGMMKFTMQPTAMANKFRSNEKYSYFKIILPFVRIEMDMEIYYPLGSFRFVSFRYIYIYKWKLLNSGRRSVFCVSFVVKWPPK